ncbi:tetratricopeptide repeat protein 38 isoform X1 [Salvia hispanica]|uniref:tetratricopeptide repeat protein 38 isoform X1 n=1 Tax=Salvia hispanica TaxID=49212 RepID=UPI002009D0DE|nr:tetratricopeptide repeat protein 38 isoform X1 [Salvia hispanica]XP_047957691.1 tetratricopeptide repeat protein 38 isoform X1 [Salvia hispanica]
MAAAEMKLDRWGYQVRTSSDACISAINDYYHQVLSYGRKRSVILEAPKSDPECVLGNILAAHFICSADPSRAPEFIDAAKSHLECASSYEKAVFEVIQYIISPDRDDDLVVQQHSKLLQDFPRDLVSLKRAQVQCFYMGRLDLFLGIVEQVLPVNDHEDYIYGMLAFTLLELGRMEDAEKAGKKGYELNKDDAWSQHALCHVYQYECRFKEAVEFMMNCAQSWGSLSSFMYTHNWWHIALCYLEGHAPITKVEDIYNEHIWKELERSDATPVEVYLNAAGLLLRLYVRGVHDILKDRLHELANCLTDQAFWFLEWHLDILILWTLSCTGRFNKAEELLKGLNSRVSMMNRKKQQQMQTGLDLAEALYRYGKGDYKKAVELLGHDFDAINYKVIGASDEQLDVFTEVHITLLLETGEVLAAKEAIEKQLKKREGAPFLWSLLEKACSILGMEEAGSYGQKAKQLEAAYFT